MIDINKKPNLTIIVAIAHNNAIGKNNDLLCHLSDDLKHFKALTTGHPVIMGRRTWDSLPKKPLPKRRNIVMTGNETFNAEGSEVAHSISGAMNLVMDEEESFIMGGAAIYNIFLPFVNRLCVTEIDADFDADVFFPVIDRSEFNQVHATEWMTDEKSGIRFRYVDYERKFRQ